MIAHPSQRGSRCSCSKPCCSDTDSLTTVPENQQKAGLQSSPPFTMRSSKVNTPFPVDSVASGMNHDRSQRRRIRRIHPGRNLHTRAPPAPTVRAWVCIRSSSLWSANLGIAARPSRRGKRDSLYRFGIPPRPPPNARWCKSTRTRLALNSTGVQIPRFRSETASTVVKLSSVSPFKTRQINTILSASTMRPQKEDVSCPRSCSTFQPPCERFWMVGATVFGDPDTGSLAG